MKNTSEEKYLLKMEFRDLGLLMSIWIVIYSFFIIFDYSICFLPFILEDFQHFIGLIFLTFGVWMLCKDIRVHKEGKDIVIDI